jgi:hypothetical protein
MCRAGQVIGDQAARGNAEDTGAGRGAAEPSPRALAAHHG